MAMTYTGDVVVGGPADVRELPALTITKVAVDEKMSNNCYLLRCNATGEQLLIDAADSPETLMPLIGGVLTTVVTTHQHWDHHRALHDVVTSTGARAVAGEPDANAITEQTRVTISQPVTDGDVVAVGDCSIEVVRITGHTPGSIVLAYDDTASGGTWHLFTGDSLFPGGVGATFGDSAAFATLIDDVEAKVFDRFPDDTWFYPGHGADGVLGNERASIPEWRERGW